MAEVSGYMNSKWAKIPKIKYIDIYKSKWKKRSDIKNQPTLKAFDYMSIYIDWSISKSSETAKQSPFLCI